MGPGSETRWVTLAEQTRVILGEPHSPEHSVQPGAVAAFSVGAKQPRKTLEIWPNSSDPRQRAQCCEATKKTVEAGGIEPLFLNDRISSEVYVLHMVLDRFSLPPFFHWGSIGANSCPQMRRIRPNVSANLKRPGTPA